MGKMKGVRWGGCELGDMSAPDIKLSGCYERGAEVNTYLHTMKNGYESRGYSC